MQVEENDKRIREAADHYHPAYDDKAWDKMEKMLDKHLPQKKDRKKIYFLLPLLLLMGGSLFFIVSDKLQKHLPQTSDISVQKNLSHKLNSTKPSSANHSESSTNTSLNESGTSEKNKGDLQMTKANSGNTIAVNTNQSPVASINKNIDKKWQANYNYKENLPVKSEIVLKQGSIEEKNNDNEISKDEPGYSRNEPLNKSNNISGQNENKTELQEIVNQTSIIRKDEIKKQDTIAKIENNQSETVKKKTKSKSSFKNNFGITLSAGPDISGVHVNDAGQLTITYGGGISYSIYKKFTIRTGFYVSKKIYSVGPNDYHLPTGSLGNYEYLQNVDANCKVYEIPINLDYSFGKIKNHSWFVSTGLSSYLMKRESYNYYYKTPAGETYNKDWTINNKNKNFFSVLNLSGGYQYYFNKQFSIMAEPYINLPLSGIGAGKVKLNSSGLLFTLTVKPFLKNRK